MTATPFRATELPPQLDPRTLLFGYDDTPSIVSVAANRHGHARVWRRVDGRVVEESDSFANWFFLARRELLEGLPVVELPRSILTDGARQAQGMIPPDGCALIELEGTHHFRYLVLTLRLDEVISHVAEAVRRGNEEGVISEAYSQLVYVRPATEQYLTISGRTYFKGMTYEDVRRLQFDFETTGLGFGLDRIFMVSVRDSDGFTALLDTEQMEEADLIRQLVQIILDRDPDVIENHNIFDFDIRFLIRRAETLGIPLPLGRDGSTFRETRDSIKIGARTDGFRRYSLTGREIIDTLHATRRYGAIQRDLRSAGLKEAARYFGIAANDREYVKGAEIWRVFQEDPERIRRYCMDDVDEVDGLSRLLLAPSFALASMVPKPFERLATAGTGQGVIEPLMVRAYLTQGHSLPSGQSTGPFAGGRTAVFTTGVVDNVVKADVASLYPSIMLADRISPSTDDLGAYLTLLRELTHLRLEHKAAARRVDASDQVRAYHDALQAAMKVLINSFYGCLGAGFALFCDTNAVERVTHRGRAILQLLLDELARRGATLIEADTDGVLFSLPPRDDGLPWSYADELRLVGDVAAAMPAGIHVEHDGRYRAMYSYLEKNYALLDYESERRDGFHQRDPVRLVGGAFRSSKAEPLVGRFLAEAVGLVLSGQGSQIRALYRGICDDLRCHRIPTVDVCVTLPLTKSPQAYPQGGRREEPYEVFLAAGNLTWKQGQRINYYQSRAGKKLLSHGSPDYDPDFYINRLRATARQRLERAFAPVDLDVLLNEQDGLFDPPLEEIHVVRETRPQLALFDGELDEEEPDAASASASSWPVRLSD